MRTSRARPKRRGFTLLELLVALAAGVLLLSVAGGVVARMADARDALARRAHTLGSARSALWLLRDELAEHRPGTLRIARDGSGDGPVVSFERDAPAPVRIVYEVERGRLVRVERDRAHPGAPGHRSVVTAGVRDFDIEALTDAAGWRRTWETSSRPRALTVALDCAGAPRLAVTVVPLVGGPA